MKSNDLSKVERSLDDVEEGMRRLRRDLDTLGTAMERLVAACEVEEEFLVIINRDRRWFQGFRGMVDDFSLTNKIRRRIPFVESRLKEEESSQKEEGRFVSRQAEDTRKSLEDLLRQFLR